MDKSNENNPEDIGMYKSSSMALAAIQDWWEPFKFNEYVSSNFFYYVFAATKLKSVDVSIPKNEFYLFSNSLPSHR